jgi:hypothetical protein
MGKVTFVAWGHHELQGGVLYGERRGNRLAMQLVEGGRRQALQGMLEERSVVACVAHGREFRCARLVW